jgi:hypothetical protein
MSELKELKEKVDFGFASIYLIESHIVCLDYKTEEIINVEKGIKVLEGIKSLTGDMRFALIVNIANLYTPFKEHFKFMVSQRSPEKDNLMARAIVTTNMASRIEMQNFINSFKPLTRTKLFSTIDEAIVWIEPQLDKEN